MIPMVSSFITGVRHLLWRPWKSAPTTLDPWVAYFQGRAYDHPRRGRRNALAAFQCYMAATKPGGGLPVAATMLGLAYRSGDGAPQDVVASRAWLERAAKDGGDPGAAILLEDCHGPEAPAPDSISDGPNP